MSGLSTMGSISLGLALVAGRKRVPRPATGKTATSTRLFFTTVIRAPAQFGGRNHTTLPYAALPAESPGTREFARGHGLSRPRVSYDAGLALGWGAAAGAAGM